MRLKIISPVHIGSGKEGVLSPYVDYVYQAGYVYYIDHKKLEEWILSRPNPESVMEDYLSKIKYRVGLREFFINHKIEVEDYSTHKIPIFGDPKKEKISRTISNAGLPYIPGSTIKGAIRTAILWKIQKEKGNINSLIKKYIEKKEKSRGYTYVGEDIFGRVGDDVMKFLQVTDTEVFSRDDLEIRHIKRISITKPRKVAIPSWVEVINPDNKEVRFDIRLKAQKRDLANIRTREVIKYLSPESGLKAIFKAVNEFSEEVIKFELEVLRDKLYFQQIVKFYKELLDEIKKLTEKESILRIGYGKTFFNNTIDLLFDKRQLDEFRQKMRIGVKNRRLVNPFPITRWVYFDAKNNPEGVLGWVRIRQ